MGDNTHIQLQLITPVSFSVIKRIASAPPKPIPPPEELFLLIVFLSPPSYTGSLALILHPISFILVVQATAMAEYIERRTQHG